jgi:regulatory protein
MDQDQEAQVVRRAKQQAYRLLAYRNQTSSELRDRLQRRGYTVAIIDEVLRQLASDGYLDDRKLALEWARYRLQAKPLGRRRLAWELRRRGVASESVEEVLREVYQEFDEVALAEQAARKRLGSKELPRSPRDRQRYVRHLLSLGFDTDTVITALAAIFPSMATLDILSDDDPC